MLILFVGDFINIQNSMITAFMFKVHFCHNVWDRYQDQSFASNIINFFSQWPSNVSWCDINYIIIVSVKNSGSCEPCAPLNKKKHDLPVEIFAGLA